MKNRADRSEGWDIIRYLDKIQSGEDDLSDSDELTRGRIRTIYVRLKYGKVSPHKIAEYYDIPVDLIKDIGQGKIFADITSAPFKED